jgi:carbon-monoxide dehydrogenase small subunit
MEQYDIILTVNGQQYPVSVRPHWRLLDVLRDPLGLTGTKEGCGSGDCGACTVLRNGQPVNACLILAAAAEGDEITTIEGLAPPGELHPLQQAFLEHSALQCGYCIPGMIVAAAAFLRDQPNPSEAEVRLAIGGNICRCQGYTLIVQAIMDTARM